MNRRRRLLSLAGALIAATPLVARADYPERSVRLVVPFAAGGVTDNLARAVAVALSRQLGQQVIVENRPGAGGTLAAAQVARAPADGHTLLLGSIGMLAIAPNLGPTAGYDWKSSFVPVVHLSSTPNLIVAHPSLPVSSIAELIAAAKAQPDRMAFASSGQGTSTHLSGALFQAQAGIRLVHVPYRGGAPALTDLLAGQIPLMFDTMSSVAAIKAGKLKALAVTSAKRSPALPDVPTVAESGLASYRTGSWNGVVAPAGLPPPVLARLNLELNRALAAPEVAAAISADGSEAVGGTPEDFSRLIATEHQRWGQVIRDAGIKAAD